MEIPKYCFTNPKARGRYLFSYERDAMLVLDYLILGSHLWKTVPLHLHNVFLSWKKPIQVFD